MATALTLSVVAAVADTWIKLGLSDIGRPAFEGATAEPVGARC